MEEDVKVSRVHQGRWRLRWPESPDEMRKGFRWCGRVCAPASVTRPGRVGLSCLRSGRPVTARSAGWPKSPNEMREGVRWCGRVGVILSGGIRSDGIRTDGQPSTICSAACPARAVDHLSGHSTRVGAAQDMIACGIELPAILQAGRWKSTSIVNRYGERLLAHRSGAAQLARMQSRE